MKRIFLIAILALLTARAPAAVKVFVKEETKLYDKQGKVVRKVTAGHAFEAHKADGKWAYGFLRLKGGGARGWIPLDALDLDDDARRRLNIPITTGKSAEPVLLRYRLEPGELQLYDADIAMNKELVEKRGRSTTLREAQTFKTEIGLRILCKGRTEDGLHTAEITFNKLRLAGEVTQNHVTVTVKANEKHVALHRDGVLVFSGTWGAPELAAMPDLSKLLDAPVRVQIDERNRTGGGSGFEAPLMEAGTEPGGSLRDDLIFPKDPVRPGDSWEQPLQGTVSDPTGEDRSVSLAGKAKYTVLERTTYLKQPCVKIRVEGTSAQDESPTDTRAGWTMEGVYLVHEARGITLYASTTTSLTVTRSAGGAVLTGKETTTMAMRYAGNKPE